MAHNCYQNPYSSFLSWVWYKLKKVHDRFQHLHFVLQAKPLITMIGLVDFLHPNPITCTASDIVLLTSACSLYDTEVANTGLH